MIAISSFMLVAGFFFWWVIIKILPKTVPETGQMTLVLLFLAIAIMQPFTGWSPGFFVRGLTGDFSFITYIMVIDAMVFRFRGIHLFRVEEKRFSLVLIALAGSVFYPLSLGVGLYDPYTSGFGSYWLVFGLFGLGVYCLFKHWYANSFALGLAMLAWSFNLYESTNLWDYVFDPWVWLYALGSCITLLALVVRRKWLHKPVSM